MMRMTMTMTTRITMGMIDGCTASAAPPHDEDEGLSEYHHDDEDEHD
jgi:hypothetical protein